MRNYIDISLFSETKQDETFPNQQFKISGYKIFRRDRNKCGGGIMFYINKNIPTVTVEGLHDDCEVTLITGMLRRNIEHFLKKSIQEKLRIFEMKYLKKVFFSISNRLFFFYFCKNMNPHFYILLFVDKSMT